MSNTTACDSNRPKDKLLKIGKDLIPQALEVLKLDFPRSIHIYYFIWMQLDWEKRKFHSNISVYCCNGKLDEGIFVAVSDLQYSDDADGCSAYRAMLYSAESDTDKLIGLLKEGDVIDWSKKIIFEAIFEAYIPLVEEICASKNLKHSNDGIFNQVWLPHEKHANIIVDVPEGTYLGDLTEEHADIVNDTWKYGTSKTLDMVKYTIIANFGIGLFRKKDSKLLAWNSMQHFGALGMLFTDTSERGKGYGRVVTLALTKALIEKNVLPYACIRENNGPSLAIYKKLGYEISDRVTWLLVYSSDELPHP